VKTTLGAAEFRDAVGWAARTLPSRPTTQMQVLGGLLLTADDGRLTVDAFDYEAARHVAVVATVHAGGRLLVGGRLLAQVAERLPGEQVELVSDGSFVVVTSDGLTARLPTLDCDDYPTLPALPAALGTVDADRLRTAVRRVTVAAGKDDTLPALTGVQVEATAGLPLRIACTDRYRLAAADVDWDCQLADGADSVISAVLPAETLRDLADSASGAVTLHVGTGAHGAGLAGLAWEDRHATTRLIDAKFPPYRRLLPADNQLAVTLTVDRAVLLDTLDRVKPVTGKTAPVMLAAAADVLTVRAKDPNGAGQIEIQASCQLDGLDTVTLAYNPHYLRDALTATSGDIARIRFVEPGKPHLVVGDDQGSYTHMLMPIRLNG
jgi:DNA polymerase-3 subunit beta